MEEKVVHTIQRFIKATETGDIAQLNAVLHADYIHCHGDLMRPDQLKRVDKTTYLNRIRWHGTYDVPRKFSLLQLDIEGALAIIKIRLVSVPNPMRLFVLVREKDQWAILGQYTHPWQYRVR